MARLLLHRERRAAAAGVRGLRVRELEAAAVEARDEVDLGAGQVRGAGRIDQDPDPIVLEHLVPLSRVLVEVELVAEPRTSAPNHRNAESVRSVTRSLTPVSHQKLGVRDRVGLVMYALRHGLSKAA